MILTTTRMRLSRLRDVASFDSVLLDELDHPVRLDRHTGTSDRSLIAVEICHAAGVLLREMMLRRCYTDRDTMRRGLSSSEHGALKNLVGALNEEARHPALRGVGMVGHVARNFPVWSCAQRPDGALWSLVPDHAGAFAVLKPTWHIDDHYPSQKITLWSPDGLAPADDRLADEALHWQFA